MKTIEVIWPCTNYKAIQTNQTGQSYRWKIVKSKRQKVESDSDEDGDPFS